MEKRSYPFGGRISFAKKKIPWKSILRNFFLLFFVRFEVFITQSWQSSVCSEENIRVTKSDVNSILGIKKHCSLKYAGILMKISKTSLSSSMFLYNYWNDEIYKSSMSMSNFELLFYTTNCRCSRLDMCY